jgi:hypothetical protein
MLSTYIDRPDGEVGILWRSVIQMQFAFSASSWRRLSIWTGDGQVVSMAREATTVNYAKYSCNTGERFMVFP